MHIAQATTTLNWGGLPNMDYDFSAYMLLAGETGSGKTSFIDVVVAAMSGGGGGSRQIVEPPHGRFTHHLELPATAEIDNEVQGWLRAAWEGAR